MTTTVTFLCGDVRDRLAELADKCADFLCTSTPFLALRSYLPPDHPDKHREIGSEGTPAAFLDTLLELTAEWRRVVAAWGSIAVELGDTYSGAGGYGKPDSVNPAYSAERFAERWEGRTAKRFKRKDDGWPEAKSLCMVPELYGVALAYGINPLTGQPSPAGRMRVRNWLTWTRPNPPVGALGDKFRPATSFVTVACTSPRRWFDLDAVREPVKHPNQSATGSGRGGEKGYEQRAGLGDYHASMSAGAPPLDWWDANDPTHITIATSDKNRWFDLDAVRGPASPNTHARIGKDGEPRHDLPSQHRDGNWTRLAQVNSDPAAGAPPLDWWDGPGQDWQPLHRLPTQPYKGSHYAAFPVALPMRLIEAMCPREVCVTCGEPRRRIVGEPHYVSNGRIVQPHVWQSGIATAGAHSFKQDGDTTRVAPTLGWSDCGHDNYRPGIVLDPFGGSGTTAVAAALCGRDAILIDLDRRNIDLCRQRLAETMHIATEVDHGDRIVWTVDPQLPGTRNEHPDQMSLFGEGVA